MSRSSTWAPKRPSSVSKLQSLKLSRHIPKPRLFLTFPLLKPSTNLLLMPMKSPRSSPLHSLPKEYPRNTPKRFFLSDLHRRRTLLSSVLPLLFASSLADPPTVCHIKPRCFQIGNAGSIMDNTVSSKLYRPGSVAYIFKSGGLSNKHNLILTHTTNTMYDSIAIGGDHYAGTTFIDCMLRYKSDLKCKMLVLLGEVGGVEDYCVIEAVKSGQIKEPIIA